MDGRMDGWICNVIGEGGWLVGDYEKLPKLR